MRAKGSRVRSKNPKKIFGKSASEASFNRIPLVITRSFPHAVIKLQFLQRLELHHARNLFAGSTLSIIFSEPRKSYLWRFEWNTTREINLLDNCLLKKNLKSFVEKNSWKDA